MSTLYRKYRPTAFGETTGQKHVVRTLSSAIKKDRIGHAFLFTGPRGIGKTTLARIFAKTINCLNPQKSKDEEIAVEPCNKCENCKMILEGKAIDLIEIDAASHTGVDNIRQLKEGVNIPPTGFNYKVYIIDEVHMLSMGAFNALLKTLEEPPKHAIFILATTELHKVPETIISRCQRFDFHRLTQDQIIERLRQMAGYEKVKIEDEALENIALEAEGGMRDAESILGQIISLEDENITAQEVSRLLGTSSKKSVLEFLEKIIAGKTEEALEIISRLQDEGFNLKNFNKQFLTLLRSCLIAKMSPGSFPKIVTNLTEEQQKSIRQSVEKTTIQSLLKLTELFQESLLRFKNTSIPQLPIEMALIEYYLYNNPEKNTLQSPPSKNEHVLKKNSETEKQPQQPPEPSPENKAEHQQKEIAVPSAEKQKNEPDSDSKKTDVSMEIILEKWNDLLEAVKPSNHSISAFLKNCIPAGTMNGKLYIKTKYDFYKDKLNEVNNKLTVQEALAKITGEKIQIQIITEEEASQLNFENSKKNKSSRNVLHDAMQIIGGKIVE